MKQKIEMLSRLVNDSNYLIQYNDFSVIKVWTDTKVQGFSMEYGDYRETIWFTDKHFSWDKFKVYKLDKNVFTS